MYEMTSNAALAQILNQFSAPMFAVERADANAPFRFVYLNDAMEQAAQCDRWDIIGKALTEALPALESDATLRRITQCVETQGVVRFRDTLTFAAGLAPWDTTLQSAMLSDGRIRVVATSILQQAPAAPPPDTVAFDDIQYFSSMADFQIQNLISMFETYQPRDLFEAEAEQRIAKLSGMCRTVQRAVADIKKSVRNARLGGQDVPDHTFARAAFVRQSSLNRCGTLKALTDFSSETVHQRDS